MQLLCLVTIAGCGDDDALVPLLVSGAPAGLPAAASLRVRLQGDSGPAKIFALADGLGGAADPARIAVYLPPRGQAQLDLEALEADGCVAARTTIAVTLETRKATEIQTVTLSALAEAQCETPFTKAFVDYVEVACAKFANCFQGDLLTLTFGDLATCRTRLRPAITTPFGLPGQRELLSPEGISRCRQALSSISCETFRDQSLGADINPGCTEGDMGTLADGAACVEDGQCASSWCPAGAEGGCGRCTPRRKLGESCSLASPCTKDLLCESGSRRCSIPRKVGEACGAEAPCQTGTACMRSMSLSPQTCVGLAKEGEPCSPSAIGAPPCPSNLYCNRTKKICERVPFNPSGGSCGINEGNGSYDECVGPNECALTEASGRGVCRALGTLGASCEAASDCLPELLCARFVGQKDFKCRLRTMELCQTGAAVKP